MYLNLMSDKGANKMAEKMLFESTLVQDFNRDIEQYHLGPLWNAIPDLMKHTPEPHAQAYLWKAELLQKANGSNANLYTRPRGERRAIYLQNRDLIIENRGDGHRLHKRYMQRFN